MQPVNRLPPEIISRIARDVPDNNAEDVKSIIPSTHVCRYWRTSIVSAPEIWTLISSKSRGLATLSLERSKEAPLQICLDMNQVRKKIGFMALITPYVHNVETLEFSNLITVDDLKRTLPHFPQTMPNLRLLDLSLSKLSPDWDSSIDPFGIFPPTLTHLFLYDIPLYPSFLNLRTLTELTLHNYKFDLPLDTILTILEENRSLERVLLRIFFMKPFLHSQRQAPIRNKLRYLSVTYYSVEDANALIPHIPLQRGANLEIDCRDENAGLNTFLPCISATYLGNLASTTRMESCERSFRMLGPNGSFSFSGLSVSEVPLVGLFPLSFANVREFFLRYPEQRGSVISPRIFHLSPFPALETLAIEHDTNASTTLSALLSTPASSPSLKTLAFLNCNLSEDFMKELARFASNRKNTVSASLHRVVIVHPGAKFPSASSIRTLGRRVPLVDVRFGTKLPADLT